MNSMIAPVEISDQFGPLRVRGNDRYRLYGEALPAKTYRLPVRNHTLSEEEERQFLFHEKFGPPLSALEGPVPTSDDPAFDKAIQTRLDAPIWERAYKVEGDISVSGKRGFVYINGRLFQPSTAEKPPPYHTTYKRLVELHRRRFAKRIELDEVLLVRHTLGHIYFHTYHDLLSKIAWADELGIDRDIPIVVSEKWATGHYGRHFVDTDLFAGRKVIFQKLDEVLVCKRLYWLRTPQFCRRLLEVVANAFPEEKPPVEIGPRLVLIRDQKTHESRTCDGMPDLIDALVREGYSALDPATLTIPQQKWVFSRAEHIVGENGSAFTNIVHRQNGPLEIDALIPSRRTTSTFQAMCKAYGFTHRSHILHSEPDGDGVRAVLGGQSKARILECAKGTRGESSEN